MEALEESRIVTFSKSITSADSTNFIQLYTPGAVGSVQLDGYLTDLFLSIDLTSITELPELDPLPEGTIMETAEERQFRYYNQVKVSPSKTLGFYTSDTVAGTKNWRFSLPMWNSRPGYQENLLPYLTTLGYNIVAYNSALWVKLEDAALGTGDKLTLHISGTEWKQLTPQTYAITSSNPTSATATTTSQVILPANPNRKLVQITNRSGEVAYLNYGVEAIPGAGIGLNPGGSTHNLKIQEINYSGAISAITGTGTALLEILEAV